MNIWRYRWGQQLPGSLIVSVTMKENNSLIKHTTFETGSRMEIRNVSLVAIELDSTIAFTSTFMGIAVHSLTFSLLLQPYNFYLPLRFLPSRKTSPLTYLFQMVDNNHGWGEGGVIKLFQVRLSCRPSPVVFPGTDHPFASQGAAKSKKRTLRGSRGLGSNWIKQDKTINLLEEDKKAFITLPQRNLLNGQLLTIIEGTMGHLYSRFWEVH